MITIPKPLIREFDYFRYDLDLPVMLDYEIWKASHMLAQTTPYDDEDAEDDTEGCARSVDGWNEDDMKQFNKDGWVSVERLI